MSSLQVRAEDQKSGKETSSPAKPNIEMVRWSDWGSNWGSDCGSVWGRAWDALTGWAGLLLVVPSTSSYTYIREMRGIYNATLGVIKELAEETCV